MIKEVDTQIPLNQLKLVEGHPTAIAFQYPGKAGIGIIIESMVKEMQRQMVGVADRLATRAHKNEDNKYGFGRWYARI